MDAACKSESLLPQQPAPPPPRRNHPGESCSLIGYASSQGKSPGHDLSRGLRWTGQLVLCLNCRKPSEAFPWVYPRHDPVEHCCNWSNFNFSCCLCPVPCKTILQSAPRHSSDTQITLLEYIVVELSLRDRVWCLQLLPKLQALRRYQLSVFYQSV